MLHVASYPERSPHRGGGRPLQGATGPEARLEDIATGRRCVLRSNNRVSMLYLLARQLEHDAKEKVPITDRGWCPDEDIACGVWGRNWQRQIKSHLYVLVHRVRKELKEGNYDLVAIVRSEDGTPAVSPKDDELTSPQRVTQTKRKPAKKQ